ncbi:MAG: ATP-binding protein [Nitrospirae bacterium]|nr:ATP-binding protein [Nitrospirota bacterium]
MNQDTRDKIHLFAQEILNASDNKVVEGKLATSERVLNRVTDGIYRQPSSALRELISNAYDADATLVEIQTDPPRFEQIIVRDNGNGLTPEALSYLIHSIGGSSKRTSDGSGMGVCSTTDKFRSPGGRKLIGKIGIGLFSVSQLTKEFQIITKTKGANHRTIADVILHTYSEDSIDTPEQEYTTGTVKIWKVTATDIDSHGTEVVLRNLLPKTKDDLTSKEMWVRCNPETTEGMTDVIIAPPNPPAFHIGCVHNDPPHLIAQRAVLPWDASDSPEKRFGKLIDKMYDLRGRTDRNPSIYDHLDYYLRMLWILSLSAPVDYVDGHPFELISESGLKIFVIGNTKKDQAEELNLDAGESIRHKLELLSPERGKTPDFRVVIDGVQLFRPIRFRNLPKTLESVPYSLLFVGKDAPDLSAYPAEVRGGDLEFEAYFFWNHTVVPKEHAGVLIRINDSNGVLFDNSFLHYPVSEQRRKDQVTAEIFVTKGLDAALNIDRESFNFSHPHYQYITHWVHNAFRQLANRHKSLAKEIRVSTKTEKAQQELDELEQQTNKSLRSIIPDEDTPLPKVEFTDDHENQVKLRKDGILAFQKSTVFKDRDETLRKTKDNKLEETKFEAQIKAVAKVLDAYGVFNDMPYDKQQRLLQDIVAIFSR